MVNKTETCKECKQFRMLCMCPRDGGSDLVEAVRRPGEKSKGPAINAKGTTLTSIAIYAAAVKRRSRMKSKSRSFGQSMTSGEAGENLEMAPGGPPLVGVEDSERSAVIKFSDEPEIVHVTKPIPASIKRKMMLRLVEAIFTTSEDTAKKPAIKAPTPEQIQAVRQWLKYCTGGGFSYSVPLYTFLIGFKLEFHDFQAQN